MTSGRAGSGLTAAVVSAAARALGAAAMWRTGRACRRCGTERASLSAIASASEFGAAGSCTATTVIASTAACAPGTTRIARNEPRRARRLSSARCTRVRAVTSGVPRRAATVSNGSSPW